MASPGSNPGYTHEDSFDDGFLAVSPVHSIYYSQYGNRDGKPVLFLHGGPGGHTSKSNTLYFNPAVYRVVLFDQRGSGKSTPNAEIRENTTEHILSDIEVLRKHINIPKWHCLFGGSWGSTLGLLYAQAHPELVGSLILQGIFAVRKVDLDWSQKTTGAGPNVFPEMFNDFLSHLPEEDRDDPCPAYYKLLTTGDRETRIAAAASWNRWDMGIGTLITNHERISKLLCDVDWSLAHATLECHYFVHGAWLEDNQILKKNNLEKIRHIPGTIIHGRYDLVCPPQAAHELHQGWPKSQMHWIPDAGHSPSEPAIRQKLIEVCDEYAQL